ncbi:hypothetical protein F5H01DRAFT_410560 [Linnemannia elongata]|nr:hypothetical protein F5H01DRAFT_410560 [Linnemannia elongata]
MAPKVSIQERTQRMCAICTACAPFSSDSHDLGAHHLPNPRPPRPPTSRGGRLRFATWTLLVSRRSSLALSVRKATQRAGGPGSEDHGLAACGACLLGLGDIQGGYGGNTLRGLLKLGNSGHLLSRPSQS